MGRYFSPAQISLAGSVFQHAERLTCKYFRLSPETIKTHRYDVKTLAFLEEHEVRKGAFAHLCKYHYRKDDKHGQTQGQEQEGGFHFYRICLQDDRILDAVERAHSFIRLSPLMLYIAAHELVHVIRFDNGETAFDLSVDEKRQEEEKVHSITRDMLQSALTPDLKLVLDCFSSRYQIGDLFS
jgi:hypothetical protein